MTKKCYSNEEILVLLKEYKNICNQAIEKARLEKIDGAINWGDLKCYETKYSINDDGSGCFQFFIDEADPVNEDLKEFLYDYILDFVEPDAFIEIYTEW